MCGRGGIGIDERKLYWACYFEVWGHLMRHYSGCPYPLNPLWYRNDLELNSNTVIWLAEEDPFQYFLLIYLRGSRTPQ